MVDVSQALSPEGSRRTLSAALCVGVLRQRCGSLLNQQFHEPKEPDSVYRKGCRRMMRPSEPALLGLTCAVFFAAALGWILHVRIEDIARDGSIIDEVPLPPVPSSEGAPPSDRRIHAVLQTGMAMLASDGVRLYRATPSDLRWRLVPTPESMWWLGHFAVHPKGAQKIFFYPERFDNVSVIDDLKTGVTRALPPKEAREWNRQRSFGLYSANLEDLK